MENQSLSHWVEPFWFLLTSAMMKLKSSYFVIVYKSSYCRWSALWHICTKQLIQLNHTGCLLGYTGCLPISGPLLYLIGCDTTIFWCWGQSLQHYSFLAQKLDNIRIHFHWWPLLKLQKYRVIFLIIEIKRSQDIRGERHLLEPNGKCTTKQMAEDMKTAKQRGYASLARPWMMSPMRTNKRSY